MKRKVVVTMSMAYWADDANYADAPSDDELVSEAEQLVDEGTIVEVSNEWVTINVEITERKP